MAIAVILDFTGATLDQYDQTIAKIGLEPGGPCPPGALFHWATESADGVRVVDVWENKEDYERFTQERVVPASQAAGVAPPSRVRFCEVHNYFTTP